MALRRLEFMGVPLLAAVMGALPLVVGNRYVLSLLIIIGLYTLIAVGLSLLMGYAGQVSLGHAAFYGLGAYGSAVLTTRYHLDPWVAMVLAAAFTSLVAYVIAGPVFRLRGHFLAMATLGWGIIVYIFLNEFRELTGGPSGLTGIPYLRVFGRPLNQDVEYYYLVWAMVLGAMLFAQSLVQSRAGRALRAIHGSEVAAGAVGIDTARYKAGVFTLSALLASLAGSLYAHYLVFVSPGPFSFRASIEFLVMGVVGGLAHIWGALFGASLITLLTEVLRAVLPRFFGFASGEYEIIAFGILLVAVMIAMPEGLWPEVLRRTRRRVGAGRVADAVPLPASVPVTGAALADPPVSAAPLPGASLPAASLSTAPLSAVTPVPSAPPHGPLTDGPEVGGALSGVKSLSGTGDGAILEVRDLTKTFGGIVAVRGLEMCVPRDRITALIGPNGAGKTTVFNLVTGLLRPTRGRIAMNGQDITGLAPHVAARRGVARTFQNVRVFRNLSVLENVMVGLHQRTRAGMVEGALRLPRARREEQFTAEEAARLLEFVGLAARAPDPAGSLPFGQQRLLEVARALAAVPRLLMLDEPAAGLTEGEQEHLGHLIRMICAGAVTVLLIEHNMGLVMGIADQVVVLNHGEKIAEGPPAVVQDDPAVITAYLGEGVIVPV